MSLLRHDSLDVFRISGLPRGLIATGVPNAAAQTSVAAAEAPSNPVDLYVLTRGAAAGPDGRATITVTVGNYGPNATRGTSSLKVVTPFFVNIDPDGALPPSSGYLFPDSRPDVPEIFQVLIPPGLRAGETRDINIPLILLPGGPRVPTIGATVFTPATGSPDSDPDLTRNTGKFALAQSSKPAPPDGSVSLYFRSEELALRPGERGELSIHFGNAGPRTTQRESYYTMTTPFHVNLDTTNGLPPHVEAIYQNSDPSVPDVVRVTVPAGLGPHTVPEWSTHIPLTAANGAPSRSVVGMGMIVPSLSADCPDTDPDPSSNHHAVGVIHLPR